MTSTTDQPNVAATPEAAENVAATPVKRRGPGRPRKWADPVPGVEMTPAQKHALQRREWSRKKYEADPDERAKYAREMYKRRMVRYRADMQMVAQIRAAVTA